MWLTRQRVSDKGWRGIVFNRTFLCRKDPAERKRKWKSSLVNRFPVAIRTSLRIRLLMRLWRMSWSTIRTVEWRSRFSWRTTTSLSPVSWEAPTIRITGSWSLTCLSVSAGRSWTTEIRFSMDRAYPISGKNRKIKIYFFNYWYFGLWKILIVEGLVIPSLRLADQSTTYTDFEDKTWSGSDQPAGLQESMRYERG